ncbi:hypothetical protein GGP80_000352 [Salinibacter ruber]|jgi:hypothetical protein|uniref:Uncharacterized protein n=1 Tax=Salinibacter ruber TaxID=146919 RepID=A0A9X2RCQ1_9BACT|nr:iron transporter [Salinibacter ruber]MBB4061352.1 hypothetical protein [Salinibacter ruber]MBB4069476.1 hypothetical protein [Salinibacter ruber]MCS3644821.1 hypothetical protein [Salinibacter ruber]MCS3658684.1 hypothetical protein [Salinibacter ruber]MCS3671023.1 hypothetical protein [Salinibacter ruber]
MTSLRVLLSLVVAGLLLQASPAQAQEQVFGEEVLGPGVKMTFLVAPAGDVEPAAQNLSESRSDLHLEVLSGWTEAASDEVGAPAGGFVPYLRLFATVTNEETGQVKKATLVPHVNQTDNFHYARNIALPGAPDDPYTVAFEVHPPQTLELATHSDWRTAYGNQLFAPATVTYNNLQLEEIVRATR